ncbi:hypothetical protein LJR042_002561 [Microbacterium maritypicum]|uniref:hypothetical protein n=1 Tax=Microbacterium TaxID=33882 RepID=UPI00141D8057|nr:MULTISPECIES: hypothetical protein [Microbacterium]NIG66444.1 hypothetical protein [Microbacterium sp. Be9]
MDNFPLAVFDGFVFPVDAPRGGEGRAVLYQQGAGEVAALLLWIDGIERAIVRAHLDGDRRKTSGLLTLAAMVPDTEIFKKFNDHQAPVSWFDHLIAPAIFGDYSNIVRAVRSRA